MAEVNQIAATGLYKNPTAGIGLLMYSNIETNNAHREVAGYATAAKAITVSVRST